MRRAARLLAGAGESPRLDAEVLLAHVLELSRSALLVRGADVLADLHRRAYDALVARREHGEPIAYLTGTREFWSLPLTITPDVLVAASRHGNPGRKGARAAAVDEPRSVLDLGTGSGAIALALASERPHARIVGVDVSEKALEVARNNARTLGLSRGERLEWRLGSWFDAVHGERFDLIAANPPYIASDDPALAHLGAEPMLALSPGPTGLEALAAIAAGAARYLLPAGWLILEHGSTQAEAVAQLLAYHGFVNIRCHADYAGKPRITLGSVHSTS